MTASFRRLGTKQELLSIDGPVSEDVIDRLRQFMRNDVIGNEFAAVPTMASKVAVEAASNLRVVAHSIEGRLAERPFEMRAALLGVPAAAADRAGLGHAWHQSTV